MLCFNHTIQKTCSSYIRAGCIYFVTFCINSIALANEDIEYRSKLLNEILSGLSDKDKELAEQLVDIRLEQEKKLGNLPATNSLKVQKEPINREISNSNPIDSQQSVVLMSQNKFPTDGTKDLYTAVGNRFVVGYSFGKTEKNGYRTEISGSSKSDTNKTVDGTTYDSYQKNTSISAYLDWYPFSSGFRLTSGVNVNDMRTKLNGVTNSKININGSQVSLGANTFNVELKFPVVTPYVGFGFLDRKIESLGFSYFGDVGLMLGKYNATATTNIIGVQSVTSADVDSELNNLRKSLFKYSFVPIANFGLTYRYQ
jgi:hypothetical protein